MDEPKVSIVVPTFNSEKTLERCLESIECQTYSFTEVIVVDGFSNDATLEIAKKHGCKVIQEEGTPAQARNIGTINASGKYVLFIDSDQLLSSQVVEECIRLSVKDRVEMVRIPEVFVGQGFWGSCSAAWKNCYEQTDRERKEQYSEPRFFAKDRIIQAGMLNGRLLWGEDYDLYGRMRKMLVKEASCKSKVYHVEPNSAKAILLKFLRYGRSMPNFRKHSDKKFFSPLVRDSVSTLKAVCKRYSNCPSTIGGCLFLFLLKAYFLGIGFVLGFSFSAQ